MEIVFGFLLFLLLTCLMAFAVWGTLYITLLIIGLALGTIKGILKDRRLSEAFNEGIDDETSDLIALLMSFAVVGISISIGSWTPVEIGMCLGAAIFYLQVWVQTGGTFSFPFRRKKVVSNKDATYALTDLGKPIGEMSQEERRVAAEKVVQTMLGQVKKQEKD